MGPFDREVFALEKVVTSLLTGPVHRILQTYITAEFVTEFISRIDLSTPRSQSINICIQGHIEVVTEDHIVTEIPHIETAGLLLTECREHNTARSGRSLRDKTEWDDQRERDICHHHIARPEDCPLLGLCHDFGRSHLQIIVGMVQIADSIFALGDIDRLVSHHLQVLTMKDTLLLLGDHIFDSRLPRFEVIIYVVDIVRLSVHRHHRSGQNVSEGVLQTRSKYGLFVDIIGHIVCLYPHISIIHLHTAVVIDHLVRPREIFDGGVLRLREDRIFEHPLIFHQRVGCRQ